MDRARCIDALVAAFRDDRLYIWLYPDEHTRPQALRDNVAFTLDLADEVGRVETSADGRAVAVWTRPGAPLLDDPAPFVSLLQRWAPDRVEDALAGMAACRVHGAPTDAVLHLLAVDPSAQGCGLGAALVAPTLEDLDASGTSAYLESSNQRNLSFYRRCGFELLDEVTLPGGGPVMRPMRGPPLPRSSS